MKKQTKGLTYITAGWTSPAETTRAQQNIHEAIREPAPKMKDKRVKRYNHRETSTERNYSETAHLWRERLNWYCSWRSVIQTDPKLLTFYQAAEFWRDPLQPSSVWFVWQKTNQTCRSSNMCFSATVCSKNGLL